MTQTDRTLKMDVILSEIEPCGELGITCKRKLTPFKPKDIGTALAAYGRIAYLMQFSREQKSGKAALADHLSHCKAVRRIDPDEPSPLALHECHEIKEFVYFSEKVRLLSQQFLIVTKDVLPDLSELFRILDPEGKRLPHFHLSGVYSVELNKVLEDLSQTHRALDQLSTERLQQASEALQIPTIKAEMVLSRMETELVASISASGFYQISDENFANITFALSPTEAMQDHKHQIARLQEELINAQNKVLEDLTVKVRAWSEKLNQAQDIIAALDWEFACARFGVERHCSIPQIHEKLEIILDEAVNLPVHDLALSKGQRYQRLSIKLTDRINVLTGPNMGGKTTALKTVGQIYRLASYAVPVPCRSAKLPLFDWIWYNQDDTTDENLSSFAREIVSFNRALAQTGRGLVLLDEFAKGTNPVEGEQIAAAVLEYLKRVDCLVFSATHFNAPAMLEDVACYAIKGIADNWFDQGDEMTKADLEKRLKLLNQAMDYKIIRLPRGKLPPRCALRIARILGMPAELINPLEIQSE
ncbi:MAG: hypothetical protein FJ042_01805 [Candidatus Cloacimonetes bacterium]|nr:hypothetical protein [Candidatus Cloacimonadota bacterium]